MAGDALCPRAVATSCRRLRVESRGLRAARQLVETDGIDRVLIAGHRNRTVAQLAETFGERAEASDFRPGDPLPDVDAVACALPDDLDPDTHRAVEDMRADPRVYLADRAVGIIVCADGAAAGWQRSPAAAPFPIMRFIP